MEDLRRPYALLLTHADQWSRDVLAAILRADRRSISDEAGKEGLRVEEEEKEGDEGEQDTLFQGLYSGVFKAGTEKEDFHGMQVFVDFIHGLEPRHGQSMLLPKEGEREI